MIRSGFLIILRSSTGSAEDEKVTQEEVGECGQGLLKGVFPSKWSSFSENFIALHSVQRAATRMVFQFDLL